MSTMGRPFEESFARYRHWVQSRGNWWIIIGVLLAFAILPILTDDFRILNLATRIAILGLAALGLNLVMGYAGQYWLGQSALFATGAYVSAIVATRWDIPFWGAAPLAMVFTAVVGLLVGLPGIRLRAFYLAMVTFYLASLVPRTATLFSEYTGGHNGLIGVPRPSIGGTAFDTEHMYWLALIILVAAIFLVRNFVNSEWGLAIRLMAHNQAVAETNGLRVWALKLRVYFLSALMVGLAGALHAHLNRFVSPGAMGFDLTVLLLAAVVVGGAGTLLGGVVGVAVLETIPELVSGFDRYSLLIYGALLLAVMVFAPAGVVPTAERLRGAAAVAVRTLVDRAWVRARGVGPPQGGQPAIIKERSATPMPKPASAVSRSHGVDSAIGLPVLTLKDVSKRFGGVIALDGVSFSVRTGDVCSVIGPNGAGKTTLINIISGVYAPDTGSVSLDRREIGRTPAFAVAEMGVRRTFQTAVVVPNLSVLENTLLGLGMPSRGILSASLGLPQRKLTRARSRERARDLLTFVGLGGLEDMPAGSLSGGQQRLLEFARALLPEPRVLMLDEPTAGLSPSEIAAMSSVIRSLSTGGVAVLMVEHNISFVMEHANSIVVLDSGSVVATGSPADIRKDERVVQAYLGDFRS